MFAKCAGPIWRRDDVSRCFQQDYLQILFPLLACALSLVLIVIQIVTFATRKRSKSDIQPVLIDILDEQEVEDDDSSEDLTLQKTTSHANHSILQIDRPRGEVWLVMTELIASIGQFAIGLVFLIGHGGHKHSQILGTSVTTTAVWAYISILVALRLFLSATRWDRLMYKLWNHTSILYGLQWAFQILVFRSEIIHPRTELSRNLVIIQFALTSLLAVIALGSRKGNKAVALEYDGEIEPSKEPLASVFSRLTFSWVDPIVWRGFKKPLEIEDVWNVTIKDKAETVLTQFRQIKKTHMLAVRLLLYFKKALLIQGAWCALGSVFMFLPTLLLKLILEYLEDPVSTPASAVWLYVALLFVTGVVQAVADGQALWIGRKICIQIRAVIIGEIYSKVLRRKAAASADAELGQEKPAKPNKLWKKIKSWRKKDFDFAKTQTEDVGQKKKVDAQANNGTIINLMSIDSFKVSEICAYLHFLWAATPVQLAMAVGLLYRILGFSSFAGISLMVLVLPLNLWIAKSFQAAQKRIMAATDGRIHATNEVLQNIRIIKYFAWEYRFEQNVNEKRRVELQSLWRKYILWSFAATVWSGVPILITFSSFLIYTMVEKRPLIPSIAFPALSMFSLLRIPLDQLADMVAHVQESMVSVNRVEEFLMEEETEKYAQLKKSRQASPHETRIALQHATMTWGSSDPTESEQSNDVFRLIDINVEFVVGELNVIAGPTGCGKTSLLMALLGEMKLLSGFIHIPGGYSRQLLRPNPQTNLTESVAYCAQQAWLVNATIKENIVFASPFDEKRYNAVIEVCALERDLEILDAGDQTLVGEKGITLSGGQKQRISLARAIYCNSKHLLLDDCLSAVDSHTAKHIFERAFMGSLMKGRTCILVSHNVSLAVPSAKMVVVLKNGKVVAQGSPAQVIGSGALGDDLLKSRPTSAMPSRAPSIHEEEQEQSHLSGGQQSKDDDPDDQPNLPKAEKKFIDTRIEKKATGSVQLATVKMYLRAMGPWYYWIVAGTAFVAVQIGSVATNLWIRQWANAYHTSEYENQHSAIHGFQHTSTGAHVLSAGLNIQIPYVGKAENISSTAAQEVDAGYYLGIYALIGFMYVLICLSRELVLFWGSQRASCEIHERLLRSILRATFRFFDSTPLGQLTNRFSKDIQAIDQDLAPVAIGLIHSIASIITVIVLISSITPGFLIPGFFIALIYIATGLFYIRASRDLKRIESVQRSPLFQHFGETLSGVVTIRAYGDESRFVQDSNQRVNTHNRPFSYLWATNRWLAFRIDIAGALVAFFSATFVVINVGKIDAGAAGLSLSYAVTFTQNVLWLVRLYAANEQNMNAVERVQEYIDVDQEAAANIPETKPAANWPSHGAVQFIDYTTRYRKDLDPVLKKLTFEIDAGEKVGIVGRTGAGKSSLALALFRGLEAEEGKVIIDGVDIGLIGLQDLREAITIVPQDPTLFTGTLRTNLDPFELFTDEEVFNALRRVQLISGTASSDSHGSGSSSPSTPSDGPTITVESSPSNEEEANGSTGTMKSDATLIRFETNTHDNKNIFYNLSSPVSESGSNLSQGQRQLLCLARALLKNPKVLVMDEATASIDYATDSKIQDTLRELKENTIITIAHRLQTIIDYDKVLVLDKGEVIEYAHPWELIQHETGTFRSMCETSGELENLLDLAKKAWQSKRLIDDS